MVQKTLHGIVRDENICETVSVVICERNSQSLAVGICYTGLRGNVGKCTVTIVVIQDISNAFEIIGVTVGA